MDFNVFYASLHILLN